MENNNSIVPVEVQIINAQAAAQYGLTPAGQMVRQFDTLQRMGKMYASATIVPDTYKGNLGNCAIALDMAQRMQVNPLMVMQNLYIVHGNPSFSTKFLISCINASKRFTPLRYEFKGKPGTDDYGCRCYAYETADTERKDALYGDWITWKMVNAEGWSKKNGSKWATMPDQMFRYRAAAFWQRVYCPEISMGFLTTEEYTDMDVIESRPLHTASRKSLMDDMAADAIKTVSSKPAELEQAAPPEAVDTTTGEIVIPGKDLFDIK